MGEMINFRHVNAEGSFTALLAHHSLEFTQSGDQVRLRCPFHDDTNPSLSITLVDTDQAKANTFHCFGCGEKGSLIDFEARLSGNDLREAARTVSAVSGCSLAPPRTSQSKRATGSKRAREPRTAAEPQKERPARRKASTGNSRQPDAPTGHNPALSFTLQLDQEHDAVLRRLDPEAAEHFGVGVATRGSMKDRICIPIHNAAGELVAYVGRWPDEDVPDGEDKYRFPAGFSKMAELFNLHRLTRTDQHIVVVEGFFSAMRMHQLGVPVVALMGTGISDEQVALLMRHGVKSALVLLDGDEPGRIASEAVGQALMRHLFTRVVDLPDGCAPDDMPEDQLATYLPYWRLRNQF